MPCAAPLSSLFCTSWVWELLEQKRERWEGLTLRQRSKLKKDRGKVQFGELLPEGVCPRKTHIAGSRRLGLIGGGGLGRGKEQKPSLIC